MVTMQRSAATVGYGRSPDARRDWKQVRQYTGRSAVGLNGTVVFCPHDEHTTSNISRFPPPSGPAPGPLDRLLALQDLQRLGAFWKPFWA
jgi:hypothetical protein